MRSLTILFGLSAIALHAQPGTLDPTFSGDGKVLINANAWYDEINAVVVRTDGKVVGTGYWGDGNYASVLVERLMPDGTADIGFGSGGMVATPAQAFFHYGYGVDMQSTNKAVVAGLAYDESFDGNVVLLRYTNNGVLDASFGNNGIVNTDLGGPVGFQSAYGMRVLPDDRILIVGQESENGLMCARFSADGVLDTTFGVSGVAYAGVSFSTGLCLDVLADGSIIAGGYVVGDDSDWLLARFDADGALMPDFGDNGILTIELNGLGAETMRGVSFTADGDIAACGFRSNTGQDDVPVVVLLDSNGGFVNTFDGDGILELPFTAPQWGQARSIEAQPGDKLLVAGFRARVGSVADNDFFLYRILSDGSFDPSFASGGEVYTDISTGIDRAYAMALSPDGSIVLAGFGTQGESATAYARYANDSPLITPPSGTTSTVTNVFPDPVIDHAWVVVKDAASVRNVQLFFADGREQKIEWTRHGERLHIAVDQGTSSGVCFLKVGFASRCETIPIVVGTH